MANTKSAAKRARQTDQRTLRNKGVNSAVRSGLKKARASIAAGNKETATADFRQTASQLDRAVKNGRLHRNAAARQKSALNRALSKLS